jgi:hypothetical protein
LPNNIRICATTGSGLSAMPIAKGNNSPSMLPKFSSSQFSMDIRTAMLWCVEVHVHTLAVAEKGYFSDCFPWMRPTLLPGE